MGASCSAPAQAQPIKVGDKVPSASLHDGFIPAGGFTVDAADKCSTGKVVVLGLPGAYTPCWSGIQVPGFLEKVSELEAAGVTKVVIFCANDGATMKAWGKDQKTEGTIIEMLADPDLEFTRACGMVMTGAPGFLGRHRCKRFFMIVVDGVVKAVAESYQAGCEPGDCDAPNGPIVSKTKVDAVLEALKGI